MMRHLYLSVILCVLISSAANAQSKSQLVEECLGSVQDGNVERALEISADILSWRSLFATQLILDARECLNLTSDEDWEYVTHLSRFVSSSERAKLALDQAEKEAQATARDAVLLGRKCEIMAQLRDKLIILQEGETTDGERKLEAATAVNLACTSWYFEDKRSALTNGVCSELFLKHGVPDSVVEGPSPMEVAAAEIGVEVAEAQILIIERAGMLPEEYSSEMSKRMKNAKNHVDECVSR